MKKYIETYCKICNNCKGYTPTHCLALGMPMDIRAVLTCKDYRIEALEQEVNKLKAKLPKEEFILFMVVDPCESQGNKFIDYYTGSYHKVFNNHDEALQYVKKHKDDALFITGFTSEETEHLYEEMQYLEEIENEFFDGSTDEELELLDDEEGEYYEDCIKY